MWACRPTRAGLNLTNKNSAPRTRGEERISKESSVNFVSYFQQAIAPYVRGRFARDERGASLVEYALLVALIAVVCIVAIQFLGTSASTKFSNVASQIG